MSDRSFPLISALICTRNRGASLIDTVSSILSNTYPNYELIIVDQSTTSETEEAIKSFCSDNRIKYFRSTTIGLGRSRNIGLAQAKGNIVAITDDDCTTPPNWLETFASIFAQHPQVAVAFCNVEEAKHNTSAGFIPTYVRPTDKLVKTIRDKCEAHGIGAGMAMRRNLLEELGGFDDLLGAGSIFPSCEDQDMAVRALLAGYHVYETSGVSVKHYGYRTWAQGRLLMRRYFLGIGAAYSKPLKCGHWNFWIVPVHDLFWFLLWPPTKDILMLRRPRGLGRIPSFLQGFIRGWMIPVDGKTLKFKVN